MNNSVIVTEGGNDFFVSPQTSAHPAVGSVDKVGSIDDGQENRKKVGGRVFPPISIPGSATRGDAVYPGVRKSWLGR